MIDYMYHPGDRVRVKPELFEYEDYKMLSGKNKGQCWLVLSWMKKIRRTRDCHSGNRTRSWCLQSTRNRWLHLD